MFPAPSIVVIRKILGTIGASHSLKREPSRSQTVSLCKTLNQALPPANTQQFKKRDIQIVSVYPTHDEKDAPVLGVAFPLTANNQIGTGLILEKDVFIDALRFCQPLPEKTSLRLTLLRDLAPEEISYWRLHNLMIPQHLHPRHDTEIKAEPSIPVLPQEILFDAVLDPQNVPIGIAPVLASSGSLSNLIDGLSTLLRGGYEYVRGFIVSTVPSSEDFIPLKEKIECESRLDLSATLWESIVLTVLAQAPSYGLEIRSRIKSLTSGDFDLGASTLYPMLKRFSANGVIKIKETVRPPDAPPRVYYQLTPQGERLLEKMRKLFATLCLDSEVQDFSTSVSFNLSKRNSRGVTKTILEILATHGELNGKGLINQSGGRLKDSNVYVTLHRMEKRGWIEMTKVIKPRARGSAQPFYKITAEGQSLLLSFKHLEKK